MSTFKIQTKEVEVKPRKEKTPLLGREKREVIRRESVRVDDSQVSALELAIRDATRAKMQESADRLLNRTTDQKPKLTRKPNTKKPPKQKLTMKRVRELFDYLPDTGQLVRKTTVGRRPSTKAGTIVGYPDSSGYLQVMVDWWQRPVHLVIWVWHHGYEPENLLDHRDRNKQNNCIENLREVSIQCNIRNTGANCRSATGIKGVRWCNTSKAWIVTVGLEKPRTIKRTPDFTEAVCHRYAAEQCLSWNDCDSNSPAYQYLKEQGIIK